MAQAATMPMMIRVRRRRRRSEVSFGVLGGSAFLWIGSLWSSSLWSSGCMPNLNSMVSSGTKCFRFFPSGVVPFF